MRRIYFPVVLRNLQQDLAGTFVALFTLEAAARALMITIVPLEAYRLLQSPLLVSLIYFATSGLGLMVSLFLPVLIHRMILRPEAQMRGATIPDIVEGIMGGVAVPGTRIGS